MARQLRWKFSSSANFSNSLSFSRSLIQPEPMASQMSPARRGLVSASQRRGVTPRRWMALSNPRLASLITETIGDGWLTNLERLRELEPYAEDSNFRMRWREIKRCNKRDFAQFARERTGILLDPDSMFDVQVKRIHEYKRQHLAILHVASL